MSDFGEASRIRIIRQDGEDETDVQLAFSSIKDNGTVDEAFPQYTKITYNLLHPNANATGVSKSTTYSRANKLKLSDGRNVVGPFKMER